MRSKTNEEKPRLIPVMTMIRMLVNDDDDDENKVGK